MPQLRRATPADSALIAQHRHSMFADNGFASEAGYAAMDSAFERWVHTRLADGRYVGLFFEEDREVLAGAGIFFMDFAPHYLDPEPVRAYLLNFYTTPQARGRGLAGQLLELAVAECRERGVAVVTLHASPFGRPIYEKFGFEQSNEMMLKLPRG